MTQPPRRHFNPNDDGMTPYALYLVSESSGALGRVPPVDRVTADRD